MTSARRYSRAFLAAWLAVSLCGGCAGPAWKLPRLRAARLGDADATTVVAQAPPSERRRPFLDRRETAEACLSNARELEAHDRDLEAIEQYERARTFQPRAPGVSRRLALLYSRQGRHDRAAEEFSTAIREEPLQADVWSDLASFQLEQGEPAEAEAAAREAIEIASQHKRAWSALGLALAEQEKFDEAHDAFTQAAGPAAAHQNLGIILARKGRADDARRRFEEARRLDPTLRPPPATAEVAAETTRRGDAQDKETARR